MLDNSIKAVISDWDMPKFDGYQLLEKVRTSRLRRLQELPFIMVSGEETEDDRLRASKLGVSDFDQGGRQQRSADRLNHLLALSDVRQTLDSERQRLVQDPVSGLYTTKYLELQAAQALSHAARHGGEVSTIVLGFDAFAALGQKLGEEVAQQVALRFARMWQEMARKIPSAITVRGSTPIVSPAPRRPCAPLLPSGCARRSKSPMSRCRGIRLP